MQRTLSNPSHTDQRVYRKWTVAFTLAYGLIFAAFVGLTLHHPPVTADDVVKVEGSKSLQLAAKKPMP
jgi:hypothetical protein